MKNIFDPEIKEELIQRINKLSPETQPLWGKMSVDQMLAHCCVPYEMAFTDKHPKPNAILRFLLKSFVKNGVVNEKPYKKNLRTAPAFIISGDRNFDEEKARLIAFLNQSVDLGKAHFEGKESISFGPMTSEEWNNQFYKHLDHHLTQFGV
ncbi:DUF1569 domain-containing protein [Algoriphagus machipongonensis]|uniref:DUF1569 domain-containing protein n=1 Tax=Algoriphagus machipongonensis TaxID=388413 RepID=A3HUM5_9BACT|nr:DUF1569 domain-containing protein [Algoriphagus machipongonensis]EAZ81847.1 hypothetical protein ALPR1_01360 [Algoriphagus machipongonensis]